MEATLPLSGSFDSSGGDMNDDQAIPVAAPIDSDSAGKGGVAALQSVFRVISRDLGSSGTGFLHKSGLVLTAEHVVRATAAPLIVFSNGGALETEILSADPDTDLAILKPKSPIRGTALPISTKNDLAVGAQVSTWGFPGGYNGALPMLSVGYLSGMTGFKKPSGKVVQQWVVNAAFNSGNSGGPLLHIETGEVIGVVSSKLAPISPTAQSALSALQNQRSGFMYSATTGDGKHIQVSEGQIVALILNELRQQVQLVIGMAALLSDLKSFLRAAQVDP